MISVGVSLSKGKTKRMKSQSVAITAGAAHMTREARLPGSIWKTSYYLTHPLHRRATCPRAAWDGEQSGLGRQQGQASAKQWGGGP